MKLIDQPVTSYLDALASDAPAPGGGSAAALCGAQGASLIEMVCRLTVGKPAYAAYDEANRAILAHAAELHAQLLTQIDADANAYLAVTSALHLPKGTDDEKTTRAAAVQSAMICAAETPLQTMQIAHEALLLAARLAPTANQNCISDVTVASLCLTACIEGARQNVLINLPYIKNEDLRAQLAAAAAQIQV